MSIDSVFSLQHFNSKLDLSSKNNHNKESSSIVSVMDFSAGINERGPQLNFFNC